MEDHSCFFVPSYTAPDVMKVFHFVLETRAKNPGEGQIGVTYRAYCAVQGEGRLRTLWGDYDIKPGDVFFTLPDMHFSIDNISDFKYLFLSFIGLRATQIMDSLKISERRCVFYGLPMVAQIWSQYLEQAGESNLAYLSESAVLLLFALLGRQSEEEKKNLAKQQPVLQVKKYLEENFQNPLLNTEKLSEVFSYNMHYLSGLFKKQTGQTIRQYLLWLRLQHACELAGTITSVQDIAAMSGFSDPLYFCKVFKKSMGVTPSAFIAQKQKNRR